MFNLIWMCLNLMRNTLGMCHAEWTVWLWSCQMRLYVWFNFNSLFALCARWRDTWQNKSILRKLLMIFNELVSFINMRTHHVIMYELVIWCAQTMLSSMNWLYDAPRPCPSSLFISCMGSKHIATIIPEAGFI